MPTIAIDYTPAIRQSAGIGRIVRGQIEALIAQNVAYDLRLLVVGPIDATARQKAPLPLSSTPISERNMVRLWHRLGSPLPRVEWFVGGPLDIFHATDFVLAPSNARRKLITVHDLAFLFYPEAAMPNLERYLNVVVPRSVHRADHLLADSQHTARDLQNEWQIPAERITVVQGAVDHERYRPLDDIEAQSAVRARYGIDRREFILALSTLQPRKNYVRLIEAFHLARQEKPIPHMLVIGGKKGWLYEEIFAKAEELKLLDQVIFPGFIDEADLPVLYRAADFFAYPSLYEGFGIPVIEALASGTPVLISNNSCLPEAGGPGARYVDAKNVEEIAQAIVDLAEDRALHAELARAGLAHAAQFTWERSAQQLLAAYQHVLAS